VLTLYQAHTSFQRKGIKGVDLSEGDRNALIEQGIDPDSLDYAGTEIEVEVSNRDTLRKQWEETCLKDQSGQLPGKTIIFAMTKKHAHRIAEVFEEMYPQHVGIVQVITSTTERVRDGSYGDGLITKFKKNNLPRIAISVDMLDTGIDVPEVVNLVFMKPVQSRIKALADDRPRHAQSAGLQIPGPSAGREEDEFKIIDFWQNDFNKKADDKPAIDMPVLVSVFNTRLKILERHLPDHTAEAFRQAITDLRAMMARVPRDSFPVKKVAASGPGVGRRLLDARHAGKTRLSPAPRCAASAIRRRCRCGRRNLHPQGGAAETSNPPDHAVAAVAPIDCGRREPAPRHRRAHPLLAQRRTRSFR
jgi:type I restriction enzyme, R subunit